MLSLWRDGWRLNRTTSPSIKCLSTMSPYWNRYINRNIYVTNNVYYVIYSDKMDHSGFFINIWVSLRMDSTFCVEHNGESVMRNTDHRPSFHFWKIANKDLHINNFIMKYINVNVSEQLITPTTTYNSATQLYKLSIIIKINQQTWTFRQPEKQENLVSHFLNLAVIWKLYSYPEQSHLSEQVTYM